MSIQRMTLNQYRVKPGYEKLLENLGEGLQETAHELFKDQSAPHRKSIASEEETALSDERQKVLEKLVEAGVVERIPLEFDVASRG